MMFDSSVIKDTVVERVPSRAVPLLKKDLPINNTTGFPIPKKIKEKETIPVKILSSSDIISDRTTINISNDDEGRLLQDIDKENNKLIESMSEEEFRQAVKVQY